MTSRQAAICEVCDVVATSPDWARCATHNQNYTGVGNYACEWCEHEKHLSHEECVICGHRCGQHELTAHLAEESSQCRGLP